MADKKKLPWLKETSDRSGFDNFKYNGTTWNKIWVSTKQNGLKIAPDEYDVPPPSNRPLGGAGISGQPRTNSDSTALPSISTPIILYITAAGGIPINSQPWVRVVGSNQVVNISANPQVSAGQAQQVLAIECVGSGVTLENGSGLTLTGSQPFAMSSGSVISLIYNATDSTWHELSRGVMFT